MTIKVRAGNPNALDVYRGEPVRTVFRYLTERGLSAYEIAVRNGYEGTEAEWIEYLMFVVSGTFPDPIVIVDPVDDLNPTTKLYVDTADAALEAMFAGYYTKVQLDAGQLDNRYYTETEIGTILSGYATDAEVAALLLSYYTSAQIDTLLTAYYTSTQVDTLLSGKSNTGHTHDDRYYTETEVDTLLSGKSNTGHTHPYAAVSHTHLAADITDLSSYTGFDARYYTETEVDTLLSGKSNTGHTHAYAPLSHTHLAADITDLSSYTGFDARYYTESEVTTLLAGKSDVGHSHPTGAHTHVAADITDLSSYTGFDARYYTEGEVDTLLAGKSSTGHTHSYGLDDLTDVAITTPATDAVVQYNGSGWVDALISSLYHGTTKVLETDASYLTLTGRALIVKDLTSLSYGEINMYGPDDGGSVIGWTKHNAGTPLTMSYILQDHTTDDMLILNFDGLLTLETANVGGTITLKHNSVTVLNTLTDGAKVTRRLNIAPVAGDVSSPANGDIWYNSTTGKFRFREAGATYGFPVNIDDLNDVTLGTAATGEVLRFNGTVWVDTFPSELYNSSTLVASTSSAKLTVNRTLNVVPTAGDIGSPANGDIWYNSTTGKFMAREAGTSYEVVSRPYDISLYVEGKPTNAELVLRMRASRAFSLPASLTGSYASARVASTGTVSFDVLKNGVSFGTITFTASATGTFTSASGSTIAAGDTLTITAPATADATLEDISITLVGTRT